MVLTEVKVNYAMATARLQYIFKHIFLECLFLAAYKTTQFLWPPAWKVVLACFAYFNLSEASVFLKGTAF